LDAGMGWRWWEVLFFSLIFTFIDHHLKF
jgi:hypothetical protein